MWVIIFYWKLFSFPFSHKLNLFHHHLNFIFYTLAASWLWSWMCHGLCVSLMSPELCPYQQPEKFPLEFCHSSPFSRSLHYNNTQIVCSPWSPLLAYSSVNLTNQDIRRLKVSHLRGITVDRYIHTFDFLTYILIFISERTNKLYSSWLCNINSFHLIKIKSIDVKLSYYWD